MVSSEVVMVDKMPRETRRYSGISKIPGGVTPDNVTVSGSGKIMEPLDCHNLQVSGWTRAKAAVHAHGNVNISGGFRAESYLMADGDVKISGTTKLTGDLVVLGQVTSSGRLRCEGNIHAVKGLKVSGSARIDGNIASKGHVELVGPITVEGSIIARSVRLGTLAKVHGSIYYLDDVDINRFSKVEFPPARLAHHDFEQKLGQLLALPPEQLALEGAEASESDSDAAINFCPNCGIKVEGSPRFCFACGIKLR